MDSNDALQKSLFYIAIQIAALWSIFLQLTAQSAEGRIEVVGLVMLTGLLLIYARKTIRILKNYEHGKEKELRQT